MEDPCWAGSWPSLCEDTWLKALGGPGIAIYSVEKGDDLVGLEPGVVSKKSQLVWLVGGGGQCCSPRGALRTPRCGLWPVVGRLGVHGDLLGTVWQRL